MSSEGDCEDAMHHEGQHDGWMDDWMDDPDDGQYDLARIQRELMEVGQMMQRQGAQMQWQA